MTWTSLPLLVLLTFPLGLLVLMVVSFRWKERALARWGDRAALARLVDPQAGRRQRVKAFLLWLGLVFVILAAAGPRWGQAFQEVHRRGIDVMIAVDVSTSMLAEDAPPNRLAQAKRELGFLIDRLEGDRVGVVAFAGRAFLQCPLTLDYGAARSLLELVGPDLIPQPGTSLADALDVATGAFPPGSKKHRALVLLTDGEDHSGRMDDAVARAAAAGIVVFAVGLGSPAGEVIPLRDANGALTGYKKDKDGRTVTTKLDAAALEKMAKATGGAVVFSGTGGVDAEKILSALRSMEKKDLESRVHGAGENRYVWPLWVGFLLLLLEFLFPEESGQWRRVAGDLRAGRWRKTAALLALTVLGASGARALGRYPESRELAEQAEKAPESFSARFDLAHGLFREERPAAAAEAFEKAATLAPTDALRGAALYNAANARLADQKMDAAIEQYKAALRANPDDPDARHNLELALRKKKEEQKQKSGSPEPKKGGMSPEDAERLLRVLAEQDKEARKKSQAARPPEPPAGKDW